MTMLFKDTVYQISITTAKGLIPYLVRELEALGFEVDSEGDSHAMTRGTIMDAMRMNLELWCAHRVLLKLFEVDAPDGPALHRALIDEPWEDYFEGRGYLCVTSVADNPTVNDSRYANLVVKDAIVDRLRIKTGTRPDSGPLRNRAVVHALWMGDRCSVFIDTSGESLSNRGYRKNPFEAPLRESLAAAILMETGWSGEGNLVNPMCGSGTLAIEAALMAQGRAPGSLRLNFGFMHLKGYDHKLWQQMKKERRTVKKSAYTKIIASDMDRRAVEAAKANAMTAGVEHQIEFMQCDFASTPVPKGGGIVIMNPPYGFRIGAESPLNALYMQIGDFLKRECSGYSGFVFTGNFDLSKKIGLRTSARTIFYNASIECRLLRYDMYEGSRRAPKQ